MGWPCLTGDRQSSYYTENSVGASARLGGRRNVSKTSQRVHQTWTSTSVLGGRLARNLELSVAESPKGASATENRRTTEKEKTWCAQSQSNLQLHCSTYPHTHVPCVGKPSGLVLASLAIYGTHHQPSVEVMVIFDFRRTNDNKGPGYTTVQEGSDDKYCKANYKSEVVIPALNKHFSKTLSLSDR